MDAYSLAVMPDFSDIMEQARAFGYDEVWAFTQAVRADGRTMVLRLVASQHRWECFHMFALGYAIWCAVYVALAVFAALTAGDSSGSSTSYEPGLHP